MFNCRFLLKLLAALALAVLLIGCGTTNRTNTINTSHITPESQQELDSLVLKKQLLELYKKHWEGVPYRFGGSSKKGIDCSALVQRIFSDHFDIDLPRTTYFQRNVGQPITKNQLRVGDLVLFKIPGPTQRHIGIYIGDNSFIHASSSQGVMISSLDNSYWKKHYSSARRILDDKTI